MKLIGSYTGLTCVTLLAGSPPEVAGDKYKLFSVNYGETIGPKREDFANFDKPGFRMVLNQFAKFMKETKGT